MPNIITRYLSKEILKSSCATVLILFIILMSNALGRILADIADGEVPLPALWPVLLSQSVNIFSLLLPIGFFLGIVFAFGRLYKDHEIAVMNACGMGYWHFYKPILLVILPVFALNAFTSIWFNSAVQRSAQEIVAAEKDVHEFDQVRAGQFNQSKSGGHVFFMESISEDKLALKNIIISQSSQNSMVLETAKSGRQTTDEETGDLFLVVGPGERTELEVGKKNAKIMQFKQHGILIAKKEITDFHSIRAREKPPLLLWHSTVIDDQVELLWRISIPFVLIVLALLAVPLSYIAPRKGQFGKIGYALLVYIVYLNLMAFAKTQLELGSIPLALNFWWIHLIFVALTIALLLKRTRGYVFIRGWGSQ
ncbi:MAG: lipopolysaccharide export system permease protein [Gammaproteobacteria bacterium]|jgi:lipopolysaccharide export system permease protein